MDSKIPEDFQIGFLTGSSKKKMSIFTSNRSGIHSEPVAYFRVHQIALIFAMEDFNQELVQSLIGSFYCIVVKPGQPSEPFQAQIIGILQF